MRIIINFYNIQLQCIQLSNIIQNMFEIYIENTVFAQAAKYLVLAKSDIETKRSEVCSQWTSAPTFIGPILIDSLEQLIIKACLATTQKKLSVIGSFVIEGNQLKMASDVIYEETRNFKQNIEDKQVCVGRCTIKITKALNKNIPQKHKDILEDDDLELKSEQSEDQNKQKYDLKFIIHCGIDFYLNEGFSISVKWGSHIQHTKTVMNKISPFWGEYISVQGPEDKLVELQVNDSKNNKLEWIKIDPRHLRISFPYHIQLKFRQQCVGVYPSIFLTILKEDVPLFSVLDRQINLGFKYVGPNMSNRRNQYILIYRKEVEDSESRLPVFILLDMKNYISFDDLNKLIEKSQMKDYEWNHWNLLLPMKSENEVIQKQKVSLLKSMFSHSLVCLYFSLDDPKSIFQKHLWNGVNIIDRKQNFEKSLKQIYYNEKKILLGKTVQIFSIQVENFQNENGAISDEDKWKILTHNYILRKKMLDNSLKTTSNFKQQITKKGEYLQQLKKILIQVRKMNTVMVEKQKSAFIPSKKDNKIQDNNEYYDLRDIIAHLFQKHQQLQQRKKINDQMRMRMDSLHHFNEDSEQLDKVLISNSEQLLKQQQMLKQMNLMKKALPKQRQVIGKLEKIFQQREVDRSMNELLKKENEKLNQMRQKKSQNLENVYRIIKDHGQGQNSLFKAIQNAQKQLITLNMEYVRLTN